MFELLSKRIINESGEPEIFEYGRFPEAFRNQVFYILKDVISPYCTYNFELWDFLRKVIVEKKD